MPVSTGHILERQDMRAVRMKKDKFKDDPAPLPLNSMPILSFWSGKIPAKIETGHCVEVLQAINVSNKPWSESFL